MRLHFGIIKNISLNTIIAVVTFLCKLLVLDTNESKIAGCDMSKDVIYNNVPSNC